MSEQGITIEERTYLEYRTDRLLEQHKIPEHTFSPSKKSVTPKEKRKSKKQKKGKEDQMKKKKWMMMAVMVLALTMMFGTTVYASGKGDVAGAIEGTWQDASAQIKTVVNKVVFPAIDLILAVFFFAKLGTAYFDYRKHGQFEWAAPAILFACLVFTLTAPTYIWKILGI